MSQKPIKTTFGGDWLNVGSDQLTGNSSIIDSNDGANVGNSVSWGVVDDTCEIVLKAELTVRGQRFTASARAFVAPPDYAPDRRPFFSMADELADRELPAVEVNEETAQLTAAEIHDLFKRIFETTSLLNLDAHLRLDECIVQL